MFTDIQSNIQSQYFAEPMIPMIVSGEYVARFSIAYYYPFVFYSVPKTSVSTAIFMVAKYLLKWLCIDNSIECLGSLFPRTLRVMGVNLRAAEGCWESW